MRLVRRLYDSFAGWEGPGGPRYDRRTVDGSFVPTIVSPHSDHGPRFPLRERDQISHVRTLTRVSVLSLPPFAPELPSVSPPRNPSGSEDGQKE